MCQNRVTIEEAQSNLKNIILDVEKGNVYVITLDEKPMAVISSPVNIQNAPVFGSAKGKIVIKDDFDEPLEDFNEYQK